MPRLRNPNSCNCIKTSHGSGRGGLGGRPAHRQSLWAGRQYSVDGRNCRRSPATSSAGMLWIFSLTILALTYEARNGLQMGEHIDSLAPFATVAVKFTEIHSNA